MWFKEKGFVTEDHYLTLKTRLVPPMPSAKAKVSALLTMSSSLGCKWFERIDDVCLMCLTEWSLKHRKVSVINIYFWQIFVELI